MIAGPHIKVTSVIDDCSCYTQAVVFGFFPLVPPTCTVSHPLLVLMVVGVIIWKICQLGNVEVNEHSS